MRLGSNYRIGTTLPTVGVTQPQIVAVGLNFGALKLSARTLVRSGSEKGCRIFVSAAERLTRMKIAVEGCMHGELDTVYATLLDLEKKENTKIDLLLCCGDFQAVRNEKDLESLNVPRKYKTMGTFWKYYSGEAVAPIPTIFIGGNHEASNYLWELYYGGWAAPNIYFLGFSGVVKFGNIRIGGLSGIYNERHYHLGHYERPPYNESDIRSIYHVREYDVHKLMQIKEHIDIFLSHDWPIGITDHGNKSELLRYKSYFKEEIDNRTLGSKAASQLLKKLQPSYWFSAHLHCQFAALVQHGEGGQSTKFLALDKCLPRRKFLQVIEIESEPGPHKIHYDEEWLAITRKLNSCIPLTRRYANLGGIQTDIDVSKRWVANKLQTRGAEPFDFARTASCHNQPDNSIPHSACIQNPQTEALLQLIELPNLLIESTTSSVARDLSTNTSADTGADVMDHNDEEIHLHDLDDSE